ncbi:hypothetical protein E2C05_32120 [Paracraurococcus ruber]|uniref:DUF4129 domain-containing protein n=2 Tax=Paracraurococcus ruber TaxID=77675 RepID=A0ABS1D724_9PROT|nr:hypothetical protein [Paracraurococcus ruber]MBK1662533.1 hypothetical protein [Paracraurococcus ruber]TDG04594.1 hypothetical protein E2C05_32120 [Paracraurococcus ruber]
MPPRLAEPPWSARLLLGMGAILVLLAGGAVLYQARRREAVVVEDAPDFARALDHWAHAAFLARPSPRAMKRFLNRLRFVAAVPESGAARLDGATVVGLGVLAHADRAALERYAAGGSLAPGAAPEVRDAIEAARWSQQEAGMPEFAPTREQARAFLALWSGVTVRA